MAPTVTPPRPADDIVTAKSAVSDTAFVLENDSDGLELTGIGEPAGGRFSFPADGLARGIVRFEAPTTPGESSVYYYTADADGTRDSAREVVRVEAEGS